MASYESVYDGSSGPLDPIYGGPATYMSALSGLSAAVDPRTANQVKEVSEHLNTGVKNVEVQGTFPEIMESIPKQHFKELNRMAKLTGAELSMHAPMVDPTGITQRGWEKINQEAAEKQLWSAIERSHELNPDGNVPVTMHASTAQLPPAEFKVKEGQEEKIKSLLLVDPNGNLHQIKEEERWFPTTEEQKVGEKMPFDPKKEMERENKEVWLKQLDNLNFYAHRGEEVIDHLNNLKEKADISKLDEKAWKQLKESGEHSEMNELKKIERDLSHGGLYLRDAYMNLKKNYDLVYKNASQKDKEKLNAFAREIQPKISEYDNIGQDPEKLIEFSEMIEKGVKTLGELKDVKILTPLRDFAIEKSAETVSNLAFKSYDKFGDTAPIISLENHPANTSILTRADDLRDVIKKARDKFVEKAVEEGISKSTAKDASEKLIGATWDVGHINMLRRYGYGKKDIIRETEKIAPYVKHVHLSDNFGHEHTELPMGMGNVPIKEILEKLGKEGFEGKKVIEAGNWWQHFSPGGKSNSPLIPTLQAMGSPLYPMQMAASWNQIYGSAGGYFAGYGAINPEIHHSLYGAGFAALPTELGGQIPGQQNRMSGTPMA